jgi:hypothetical protein
MVVVNVFAQGLPQGTLAMRAQSMTAPLLPTYGVIEIPSWQWINEIF